MKKCLFILLCLLVLTAWRGGSTTGWHNLNIGSGGYYMDLAFSCDGVTKTVRNDSGDAYYYNNTDQMWEWINTAANLSYQPNKDVASPQSGYSTAVGCQHNGRILYWHGENILLSNNGGASFSLTNFPGSDPVTMPFNDNNGLGTNGKASGPRSLFDPNNDDIAYACTAAEGIFKSVNGAIDWSLVGGIPSAMPWQNFQTPPITTAPSVTSATTLVVGLQGATNAPTASGLTLHFATGGSFPAGVVVGYQIIDITTPSAISAGTTISASSSVAGTITLSKAVSATVNSGDTIAYAPIIGSYIYDVTNPLTIQQGTVSLGPDANGIKLSKPVADGGVGGVQIGDTLRVALVAGNQTAVNSATGSGNQLHFAGTTNQGYGTRIYDLTNPDRIAVGTYITNMDYPNNLLMTLSQSVQGAGVVNGDLIFIPNSINTNNNPSFPACGIAIDPTVVVGGVSQHIIIWPTNRGLWESSDGGTTWAKMTAASGPGNSSWNTKMRFASDGTLWVVSAPSDYTASINNFWRYSGGSSGSSSGAWKQFTHTEIPKNEAGISFAVDPNNPDKVLYGDYLFSTTNGTAATPTWAGQSFGPSYDPKGGGNKDATGDEQWLDNNAGFLADASMLFDKGTGKVWLSEGTGIYNTTPIYSKQAFTWQASAIGGENLAAQSLRATPEGGGGILAVSSDKPAFYTYPIYTFKRQYPTAPSNSIVSLSEGWNADYASSDPKTMCLLANKAGVGSQTSGCSTDSGRTGTWSTFVTDPWTLSPAVTVQSNSGTNVLHFGANLPANLQIQTNSFPQVYQQAHHWLTATAPTPADQSPGILHFGAGNIPADITAGVPLGAQWFRRNNAQRFFGFNQVNGIAGITCIDRVGGACAGGTTSAGDIVINGNIGPKGVDVGDQININLNVNILGVATTVITCIDRTGGACAGGTTSIGDIVLANNLTANVLVGQQIFISQTQGNGGGSQACATPTNCIYLGQNNFPYPYITNDGGVSWNPVLVADATNCTGGGTCPGFNADGSAIPEAGTGSTGWGISYFNLTKQVAADRVNIGTYYMLNCRTKAAGGGVYASQDFGSTWVRIYDGTTQFSACQGGTKIETVPGHAGWLLLTGSFFANFGLFKITNGTCGTVNCSNLAVVPGTGSIFFWFAMSAPAPGKTFPTLWVYGRIGGAGHAVDLYQAKDMDQATPTFVQKNARPIKNLLSAPNCLEGDPNVWYRVYACQGGHGWAWGDFPYLLNRDLDPAANDNSPAFLDKVG